MMKIPPCMSNTGDVLDKWACSSDNPYLMAIADRNLATEALLGVLVLIVFILMFFFLRSQGKMTF